MIPLLLETQAYEVVTAKSASRSVLESAPRRLSSAAPAATPRVADR